MTIQLGRISIQYESEGLASPQAQHAIEVLREGMQRYRVRRERISTLGLLVRRWLVGPVVIGVLIGLLMQ